MKKHNAFVVSFLKNHGNQDMIDAWNATDNQEKWLKLRFRDPNGKKRRSTCYILYCMDYRKILSEKYPFYPNSRITAMLGTEWKQHKKDNDEVYQKYVEQDRKQVFFEDHRPDVERRYPHLTQEALIALLEKMYKKFISPE